MGQVFLIGFERNIGTFTNKTTGEVVSYSNRTIHFISDECSDEKNVGFSAFDRKIKLSDLSRLLNVRDDDSAVDNSLKSMINKPVNLKFALRGDDVIVTQLSPHS